MIILQGTVIPGEQIGERQGYPTANFTRHILRKHKLANGVYAARITIDGAQYRALLIIGVPGKRKQRGGKVELYILGYPRQILYGRQLSFQVYKKLRPIVFFDRHADLMKQIKKDIRDVRQYQYPR